MRDLVRLVLIVSLLVPVLDGCMMMKGGGEPAAGVDAPPPPGYKPLYVRNVRPMSSTGPSSSDSLSIGRIVATDPGRARIYIQLVDPDGNHISGATALKSKSVWCAVEDKFNGRTTSPKFTLREVTEADREPYAISLVMDHSGSMGEERALAVQNAISGLVKRKKPEDAMALIKYDNRVGIESSLSADPSVLDSRLQKNGLAGYGGMTAIMDGITTGIDQVASAKNFRQRAVVVFTDGKDNSSTVNADSVILLARRSGTIINAIDFGYGVSSDVLRTIAKGTGGIYYQIYKTDEFDVVFDDIYRRLHNYYLIEYALKDFGVHDVTVKLCLPNDTLIATGTYDNSPYIGAVALLDVNFDVNRHDILAVSMPAVDNVVSLMKAYPSMTIELRGHTDSTNSTGDPDYNLKLSQRRADAVKKAMVDRGIQVGRIGAAGFGDRFPVADNATEEGRARNRRTEFAILSK